MAEPLSKTEFFKRVERLEQNVSYKTYLAAREAVFAMRDHAPSGGTGASSYWSEEISGFEYMLDASPLIVERLRHHTYHLTGLYEYEYRGHHGAKKGGHERKLAMLRAIDRSGLFVPESPALGGFGHALDGGLVNTDTLKFYETLIGIDRSGIAADIKKKNNPFVLEIGAGWGGFAYQWKTLFPNTTYCIVDFPEVLLFAATYLGSLFPDAKIFFADGTEESVSRLAARPYDFLFIPHYLWSKLSCETPDLLVNIASFQEMTTAQVEGYVSKAAAWGIPAIYSLNRNRSPYNRELSSVPDILGKQYALREVTVLPLQYTEMPAAGTPTLFGRMKKAYADIRWGTARSAHRYRHYAGSLKM